MCFHLGLLLSLLLGAPVLAGPHWFGFAGVACGLDDPHGDAATIDYSEEVAGFTNLSQVCPIRDVEASAALLARAAERFTPLYAVEPFLFETRAGRLQPLAAPSSMRASASAG